MERKKDKREWEGGNEGKVWAYFRLGGLREERLAWGNIRKQGWNLAPYLSTKILPVRARTSAEGKLVCSVDVEYWCWERLTRGGDVILHRIRLGYHWAWQIIDTIEHGDRCCKHCAEPDTTLLHYLQRCERAWFPRQEPLTTDAFSSG